MPQAETDNFLPSGLNDIREVLSARVAFERASACRLDYRHQSLLSEGSWLLV
jgi:hypothetical protein